MALEKYELEVEIELLEEILGTSPADKDIYTRFIASKFEDDESEESRRIREELELENIEEGVEKGTTIFPKVNGVPFIYDYQIRGFFKSACQALKALPDTLSKNIKAYKKLVDTQIFIKDRMNFITKEDGSSVEINICERPLRAQTMQGERVSLARSESIGAGARIKFTVVVLDKKNLDYVEEWLEYGVFNGLGQWRNSGKGKFMVISLNRPYEAKKGQKQRFDSETGVVIEE